MAQLRLLVGVQEVLIISTFLHPHPALSAHAATGGRRERREVGLRKKAVATFELVLSLALSMPSTSESAKLESMTLGFVTKFKLACLSISLIALSNFELFSPLTKIKAIISQYKKIKGENHLSWNDFNNLDLNTTKSIKIIPTVVSDA